MNHKWENNVCVNCGLTRERRYWKQLMAIVNHPPWEAYRTGVSYWYGNRYKFNRPSCPIDTKQMNGATTSRNSKK
jgi:hypothetical protein